MRLSCVFPLISVFLFCYSAVFGQDGASRSAIFVIGPAAGDTLQLAHSEAFACRRWLRDVGSTAELRHAGSSETADLGKLPAKGLEAAFQAAAKDAADREPADLVSTLDDAVHTLAGRPGQRVAVAVLDAAPLSPDTSESLRQVIQYASDNSIRLIFLDPSAAPAANLAEIWKLTGSATGGAFLQEPDKLSATVLSVAGMKVTAADKEAMIAAPSTLKSDFAWNLPVRVRFIQISNRPGSTQSVQRYLTGPGLSQSTQVVGESASRVEGVTGPLHGYLIVQAPIEKLHFEQDARSGKFLARALVTQRVRDANGKIVWQAKKDVKIDGPLAKLKERQEGNVYYMRDVLLPGGRFTLEATVEDELAHKTGGVRTPLSTGSGVPGLMVSDAMFVKAFHSNIDKFEADSVLNYQGYAIAPLLEPEFPADTPFKVEMYFIIYPDIYGTQPVISMEILQEGKVISQASMPFNTPLRNSTQEGKGTSIVGELQHGFDYLASMNVEKMSASNCQARLTVTQGRSVVTRLVNFKVVRPGGAVTASSAEAKPAN